MKYVILAVLFASTAFAGREAGNGGVMVACRINGQMAQQAELPQVLDIYEARVLGRGLKPEYPAGDERTKAYWALDQLAKISPRRAARYREQFDDFLSRDSVFLDNAEFSPTNDWGNIALPSYAGYKCGVEQVVVQKTPEVPEDRRYQISSNLWQYLDTTNRVTMMLHEIIYREAIEHKHQDSVRTRYFNSYIFSGKIGSVVSQEQKVKLFTYLNLPIELYGLELEMDYRLRFYPNGGVKEASVVSAGVLTESLSAALTGPICLRGDVEFSPNGKITKANLCSENEAMFIVRGTEREYHFQFPLVRLSYDAQGKAESVWGMLLNQQVVNCKLGSTEVKPRELQKGSFYTYNFSNGRIYEDSRLICQLF